MIVKKSILHKRLCFAALPAVFILAGCLRAPGTTAQTEYALGTFCTIELFENGSSGLYNRLFTRLAELEQKLSANRDDSELVMVNRNAGLGPVQISPELLVVLERALYFAGISGGAFDPTAGPLVKLWGIGTETPRIPSNGEIDAVLDLVDWRELETVQNAVNTAFLKRQGMALDLGAIAKGYAADELVRILAEENIPRAIINLGGDLYVWGTKTDGKPWFIGIQDPLDDPGNYSGILELRGSTSVVSSGVYERYFTGNDGKRYHHILGLTENEAERGYPAENGILSVTVIAPSAMDADALSTACFILGYEQGLALANGAEILFIFEDKTIRGSPGALAIFTPAGDYKVVD